MNKLLLIFIAIFLFSCTSLKKTSIELFDNRVYVCDLGGMMGKSVLTFSNNTFIYSERDSLFVGTGKWYFTNKGKNLIINGKISNFHNSPDLSIEKTLNLEFKIKGKNKLVGDNKIFIREKIY